MLLLTPNYVMLEWTTLTPGGAAAPAAFGGPDPGGASSQLNLGALAYLTGLAGGGTTPRPPRQHTQIFFI